MQIYAKESRVDIRVWIWMEASLSGARPTTVQPAEFSVWVLTNNGSFLTPFAKEPRIGCGLCFERWRDRRYVAFLIRSAHTSKANKDCCNRHQGKGSVLYVPCEVDSRSERFIFSRRHKAPQGWEKQIPFS
jgi:hypothetical protein